MLPLRPSDRLDIVNVDFVAESIVTLHQKERPLHDTYHLSAGLGSPMCKEITDALNAARHSRGPIYIPILEKPFSGLVDWLANRRGTSAGHLASLMKVFLPYLLWNTVFDNSHVVQETGKSPARFSDYCYPRYQFSIKNRFVYPYRDWSEVRGRVAG